MNKKIGVHIIFQIGIFIFSLAGVLTKWMGNSLKQQGLSWQFMILGIGVLGIYFIYALIWQIVLKAMDLSVAYLIKTITLIWSLLWSVIIFKQQLTMSQLLGVLLIGIGIFILQRRRT